MDAIVVRRSGLELFLATAGVVLGFMLALPAIFSLHDASSASEFVRSHDKQLLILVMSIAGASAILCMRKYVLSDVRIAVLNHWTGRLIREYQLTDLHKVITIPSEPVGGLISAKRKIRLEFHSGASLFIPCSFIGAEDLLKRLCTGF